MSEQLGVVFTTRAPTPLSPGTLRIFIAQTGQSYWDIPLRGYARAFVGDHGRVCVVEREHMHPDYSVRSLDIVRRQTRWTITRPGGMKLFPIALSDDTITLAEEIADGVLITALDSRDGNQRWRQEIPRALLSSFSGLLRPRPVQSDDLLLLPLQDGDARHSMVVALDARDGRERWRLNGTTLSQPYPLSPELITCYNMPRADTERGVMLAVDRLTGVPRWRQTFDGPFNVLSAPTTVAARCFVGVFSSVTMSGAVACLDGATGAMLWKTTIDAAAPSRPVVDQDDNVYVGATMVPGLQSVTKLDARNGWILWRTTHVPPPLPPLPVDDRVYVGTETLFRLSPYEGQCVALDAASGAIRWSAQPLEPPIIKQTPALRSGSAGYHLKAQPLVTRDGHTVVFARSRYELVARDALQGDPRWESRTEEIIRWYCLTECVV